MNGNGRVGVVVLEVWGVVAERRDLPLEVFVGGMVVVLLCGVVVVVWVRLRLWFWLLWRLGVPRW